MDNLPEKNFKLFRSWSYAVKDFAPELEALQRSGNLRRDCQFPLLWKTSQKYVLKAADSTGRAFAYKTYDNLKKRWKYLFRLSPCGAEARNFLRISALDIPMPQLLAAGDIRKNTVLQSAYIATEFAEGYRDGRDFFGNGSLACDHALRDEFITRNMQLLARCHDNNILHRGFTPANLLYKVKESAGESDKLDLMWIDVASCRKVPAFYLKANLIIDFEQFFRFFDFDDSALLHYIKFYIDASNRPPATAEKIVKKLRKAIAKRNKGK